MGHDRLLIKRFGSIPIEMGRGSSDALRPVMWECDNCWEKIEGDSDGSQPEVCPNCSIQPINIRLLWNRLKKQ